MNSPTSPNVEQNNLRRVVISSLIGATIEWYDFFLYGVVAGLLFNKLFFPSFDPLTGTIMAFGTFAVGFVARPLGGLYSVTSGTSWAARRCLSSLCRSWAWAR